MDAKLVMGLVVGCVSAAGVAVADQPGEHHDPPPVTDAVISLYAEGAVDANQEVPDTLPAPPWAAPTGDGKQPNVLSDAFLVPLRADVPAGEPRLLPTPPEGATRVRLAGAWSAAWTEPDKKGLVENGPLENESVLARAERLAAKAETRPELTGVIDACLLNNPRGVASGDEQASLRRLAAWAYNRRGELAVEAGDARQAREDFERAIATDPGCWSALHNRGVSHAERGRLHAAIADLTRAIELNPRFATAYRNRGEAWRERGDLERAVFDFTAAIALGPVDPATLVARGDAHHRRGQIDLAVADYNLALGLVPEDAETLARRGDVYAQVGNYPQAVADYAASLRVDPQAAATRRSYAWLLATCPEPQVRNPVEAVRQAEEAVRLAIGVLADAEAGDDDLALHLDTLAVALAADGRFERAVRQERHALEIASAALSETLDRRLAAFERGEAVGSKTGKR